MTVDPLLAGSHAVALTGLAGGYRPRSVTPLVPWRLDDGWLVKPYVVTADRVSWNDDQVEAARIVVERQLGFDRALGGVGLAVVVLHLSPDSISLLVQSWVARYQTRIALFDGVDADYLRPTPIGIGPSVWDQQVLAHEREAYVAHILGDDVDTAAWLDDVLDTR